MVEESEKKETVEYLDLEPYTRICIESFRTLMKRELSLKKANVELGKWIVFVSDKDLKGYVQITEKIRTEYEEKIANLETSEKLKGVLKN